MVESEEGASSCGLVVWGMDLSSGNRPVRAAPGTIRGFFSNSQSHPPGAKSSDFAPRGSTAAFILISLAKSFDLCYTDLVPWVMTIGSRAASCCESCQGRKAAALNRIWRAPRERPVRTRGIFCFSARGGDFREIFYTKSHIPRNFRWKTGANYATIGIYCSESGGVFP